MYVKWKDGTYKSIPHVCSVATFTTADNMVMLYQVRVKFQFLKLIRCITRTFLDCGCKVFLYSVTHLLILRIQ